MSWPILVEYFVSDVQRSDILALRGFLKVGVWVRCNSMEG